MSAARMRAVVIAGLLGSALVALLVVGSDHQDGGLLWAVFGPAILWSFVGTGLYASHKRPESRTGELMVWLGFAWVLSALTFANDPTIYTLGMIAGGLWGGVFLQLVLTFPSGRLTPGWDRRLVIAGYLALMAGGTIVAGRIVTGFLPPGIATGLPLMLLEAMVLLTLSIAAGTRLSTLAGGVTVFGLYGIAFLGGWFEQIGTILGNGAARYLATIASLFMPSESMWQRAAWFMQTPIVRDLHMSPFSPASLPSEAMVAWAVGYAACVLAFAVHSFGRRPL